MNKGHACHFRCNINDVKGLRIDVMSKLRGCAPFNILWKRKKTVVLANGKDIDVIGLQDLVQSKKTQQDKDWLMLKRLVDNDIRMHTGIPSINRIRWWLQECRDASLLIELVKQYASTAQKYIQQRPLLSSAISSNYQKLNELLQKEEIIERKKDVAYWTPLKKELESLRHHKEH